MNPARERIGIGQALYPEAIARMAFQMGLLNLTTAQMPLLYSTAHYHACHHEPLGNVLFCSSLVAAGQFILRPASSGESHHNGVEGKRNLLSVAGV